MSVIINANNLNLEYKKGETIIRDANFSINQKDFVFISGASGSGKSTLLKALYGNLRFNRGSLSVCGVDMKNADKNKINSLRRHIGIIFQDYKLIKEWDIEKNVMLPMIINGYTLDVCQTQANKLLLHVKLSHKSKRYPLELSGGEQQRVAMARALSHNPILILADEPTGNLDDYSSDMIWGLLKGVNEQFGMTVVVVTHRVPLKIEIPHRRLYIEDGTVYEYN